jgi:uncharacterized membrane protein
MKMMSKTSYLSLSLLTSCLLVSQFAPQNLYANTETYRVNGVKSWDSLNIRSTPGARSQVVSTIPADGKSIVSTGKSTTIGKTTWLEIKWHGFSGWVSKQYLELVEAINEVEKESDAHKTLSGHTATNKKATANPVASVKEQQNKAKQQGSAASSNNQAENKKGTWVLECGSNTPFWKVEVRPKSLQIEKGDFKTVVPITEKMQEKSKWNTARKTVIKGNKGRNNIEMIIRYTRSCQDTLSNQRVPYKVIAEFNGKEMSGCCRAVKLDN